MTICNSGTLRQASISALWEKRVLRPAAFAFSPDGAYLARAGFDPGSIIDVASGIIVRKLSETSAKATTVSYSADGKRILTGSVEAARLWNAGTGRELRSFSGTYWQGSAIATLFPDGHRVLAGGGDRFTPLEKDEPPEDGPPGSISRIWDAESGREITRLRGQSREVDLVAASPDGSWLVTTNCGTLHVWSTKSGMIERRIEGAAKAIKTLLFPSGYSNTTALKQVAFASEGDQALVSDHSGQAILVDLARGRKVHSLQPPVDGKPLMVAGVALSADGRRALTGTKGYAVLWDVGSGKEIG